MRFDEFRTQVNDTFPTAWEFSDTSVDTLSRLGAGGCGGYCRRSYVASTDLITLTWDGNSDLPVTISVESTNMFGTKVLMSFCCRTLGGARDLLAGLESGLSAALDGPKVPEGKTS